MKTTEYFEVLWACRIKGALDKINIIPKLLCKHFEFFASSKVLPVKMTAYKVSLSNSNSMYEKKLNFLSFLFIVVDNRKYCPLLLKIEN